jgi:hypothetical protein
MEPPYESLPDNPQAAVTIITTEHFNLQTARAATISESNGRTSIFLGAVSAGLVALAFAGQASRTTLLTFGLVLFPVLAFLGLVTFERVLQASIEDALYLQRINRIRRFTTRPRPASVATSGALLRPTTSSASWRSTATRGPAGKSCSARSAW